MWRESELVTERSEDGGSGGASSLPKREAGHEEGSQASLRSACEEQVVCLERWNVLRFAHFHGAITFIILC